MADYVNPLSVLPNMQQEFGIGPMSGMMAGQRMSIGLDMLGKAQQSQGMDLDAQRMRLDEQAKDVPYKDLQRQFNTGGLQDDLGIQQSGLARDAKVSKLGKTIDDDTQSVQDNKIKRQLQMAGQAEALDETLKSAGATHNIPMQLFQQVQQRWQAMGFPPLPPDPIEARQKIAQYSAWNKHEGARLAETRKQEHDIAKIEATGNEARKTAEVKGDLAVRAAEVRAVAAGGMPNIEKRIVALTDKKATGTLTQQEKQQLEDLTLLKLALKPEGAGDKIQDVKNAAGAPPGSPTTDQRVMDRFSSGEATPPKNPDATPVWGQAPKKIDQIYQTPKGRGRYKGKDAQGKDLFEKVD
jgi:hypothetical protein